MDKKPNVFPKVETKQTTATLSEAERIAQFEAEKKAVTQHIYEQSKSVQKMRQTSTTGTDTNSNDSQDSTTIQAAYTMGGMTFAVSQASVDGDGYTKEAAAASRVDVKETIFAITMAF